MFHCSDLSNKYCVQFVSEWQDNIKKDLRNKDQLDRSYGITTLSMAQIVLASSDRIMNKL